MIAFDQLTWLHGKPQSSGLLKANPEDFLVVEDLGFAPDFVKLAEAYGLKGAHVSTVEELKAAIEEAKEWGHGYVVDCLIDTDEMVRPMVGGGQPITNFMLI